MGEDETHRDPYVDGVLVPDEQIIGHFDAGPAGVGPMVDVKSGDFYPSLPAAESAALDSPTD